MLAAFLLAKSPLNLRLLAVLIRIDWYLTALHCCGEWRLVLSRWLLGALGYMFFSPRGAGLVSYPIPLPFRRCCWDGH
jgi:hypothetical protein